MVYLKILACFFHLIRTFENTILPLQMYTYIHIYMIDTINQKAYEQITFLFHQNAGIVNQILSKNLSYNQI